MDLLRKEFQTLIKNGAGRKAAPVAAPAAKEEHGFLDLGGEAPKPTAKAAAAAAAAATKAEGRIVNEGTKLQYEKELLGFYVSGHPMDAYEGLAEAIDTYEPEELLKQGDRTEFRLCGIASGIGKKLSKKDNRPWAPFTLSTRRAALQLNMFADAFEKYGKNLAENATVLVAGNIIAGQEGPRINVKECYPLDQSVATTVKKVTFVVKPEHKELIGFMQLLREALNKGPGETKVELAFLMEDRVAPVAEVSTALTWKVFGKAFQPLRKHPAVAGVVIETRHLELKNDRKWGPKKPMGGG